MIRKRPASLPNTIAHSQLSFRSKDCSLLAEGQLLGRKGVDVKENNICLQTFASSLCFSDQSVISQCLYHSQLQPVDFGKFEKIDLYIRICHGVSINKQDSLVQSILCHCVNGSETSLEFLSERSWIPSEIWGLHGDPGICILTNKWPRVPTLRNKYVFALCFYKYHIIF